jgi:exoribonuclease II
VVLINNYYLESLLFPVRVIQKADSKFLEKVSNHPQVKVIEVTCENRDELAKIIKENDWIKSTF